MMVARVQNFLYWEPDVEKSSTEQRHNIMHHLFDGKFMSQLQFDSPS